HGGGGGRGERGTAVGLGAAQRLFVALRRGRERVGRVVERREVQKRREVVARRGHVRLARIGGGREQALVELTVPLPDLLLFVFRKLLDLFGVLAHGLGQSRELIRQDFGVGEAHHGGAHRLRQGAPVHERRVVEGREPL